MHTVAIMLKSGKCWAAQWQMYVFYVSNKIVETRACLGSSKRLGEGRSIDLSWFYLGDFQMDVGPVAQLVRADRS